MDLSPSALMTPKADEKRGNGASFFGGNLCTINLQASEVAEGQQFCLLPTPELERFPASGEMSGVEAADDETVQDGRRLCLLPTPELPAPSSPEAAVEPNGSPGSMQRRFMDRVEDASLTRSPEVEVLQESACTAKGHVLTSRLPQPRTKFEFPVGNKENASSRPAHGKIASCNRAKLHSSHTAHPKAATTGAQKLVGAMVETKKGAASSVLDGHRLKAWFR